MLALCYSKLTGGGRGGGLPKVMPKRGVRGEGQHNRAGQVWVHGNLNFRFNCQMKNEFRFSTRIENFEFKELEWNQLIYIWLRREIPSSLFTNFSFLPLAYFPRPNCFSFCAGLLSPLLAPSLLPLLPAPLSGCLWLCRIKCDLSVAKIYLSKAFLHMCTYVCVCVHVTVYKHVKCTRSQKGKAKWSLLLGSAERTRGLSNGYNCTLYTNGYKQMKLYISWYNLYCSCLQWIGTNVPRESYQWYKCTNVFKFIR